MEDRSVVKTKQESSIKLASLPGARHSTAAFGYRSSRECPNIEDGSTTTNINEPQHDKINKMTSAPSEDSDQPGIIGSLATHTVHSDD